MTNKELRQRANDIDLVKTQPTPLERMVADKWARESGIYTQELVEYACKLLIATR